MFALADRIECGQHPVLSGIAAPWRNKIKLPDGKLSSARRGNGYPPIIDQDTFQQVQEKIPERQVEVSTPDGIGWLMARRCGGCHQTRLLRTGGPIAAYRNHHLKCSACRNARCQRKDCLRRRHGSLRHMKNPCKPYAPSAEAVRLANAKQPGAGNPARRFGQGGSLHILQGAYRMPAVSHWWIRL